MKGRFEKRTAVYKPSAPAKRISFESLLAARAMRECVCANVIDMMNRTQAKAVDLKARREAGRSSCLVRFVVGRRVVYFQTYTQACRIAARPSGREGNRLPRMDMMYPKLM